MSSSVKVRLVLTSLTLSCDQIRAKSGIEFSHNWRQGEAVHPKAINLHKHNGCVLEVRGDHLSLAAAELIGEIDRQGALKVRPLDPSIDVEVSCVVEIDGGVPELHLDSEVVRFANSLGASIDFDVYVLSE